VEIHREAKKMLTWRHRMSEFGNALGSNDQLRLDENLEVVDLEAVDSQGHMYLYNILELDDVISLVESSCTP